MSPCSLRGENDLNPPQLGFKTQYEVRPYSPHAYLLATLFNLMKGDIMSRKYIDCREFPGDIKCSLALVADSEEELLEAAIQHGVAVHGYSDTPEFRQEIKTCFHDGTPPAEVPKPATG